MYIDIDSMQFRFSPFLYKILNDVMLTLTGQEKVSKLHLVMKNLFAIEIFMIYFAKTGRRGLTELVFQ